MESRAPYRSTATWRVVPGIPDRLYRECNAERRSKQDYRRSLFGKDFLWFQLPDMGTDLLSRYGCGFPGKPR